MNNKPRKMSIKGFIHKSSQRISPASFIVEHREWLLSVELAPITAPILDRLVRKEIHPTSALHSLKDALLAHMLNQEIQKAEKQVANQHANNQPKAWCATIYNSRGEVQVKGEDELVKEFDLSSDADRWVDRRLFEGASDWFGVISHTSMVTKDGDLFSNVVLRGDAIARILKTPKGAVSKQQSKTTDRLKFGVKTHNDRSIFSHG